jgi:hypothetical protein
MNKLEQAEIDFKTKHSFLWIFDLEISIVLVELKIIEEENRRLLDKKYHKQCLIREMDEIKKDIYKLRQEDIDPWWRNYFINIYQDRLNQLNKKLYFLQPPKKADGEYDIQKIKEIPIQEFYQGRLRPTGRLLTGKCPFHDDGSASFFIYPTNTFHCFGCQGGVDVIDFVMKLKNCDFKEAINILCQK